MIFFLSVAQTFYVLFLYGTLKKCFVFLLKYVFDIYLQKFWSFLSSKNPFIVSISLHFQWMSLIFIPLPSPLNIHYIGSLKVFLDFYLCIPCKTHFVNVNVIVTIYFMVIFLNHLCQPEDNCTRLNCFKIGVCPVSKSNKDISVFDWVYLSSDMRVLRELLDVVKLIA